MSLAEPSGLAQALRVGTRTAHDAAENSTAVGRLAVGKISAPEYARLVRRFAVIYQCLEEAMARSCVPRWMERQTLEATSRSKALEMDRTFWNGVAGPAGELVATSPAVVRYLDALTVAEADEPRRLLSHWYVRLGGDMAGGNVIGRQLLQRFESLGLEWGKPGLAWYDFGDAAAVRAKRHRLRETLDRISSEEELLAAMVAEANVAFVLSVAVIEEALEE